MVGQFRQIRTRYAAGAVALAVAASLMAVSPAAAQVQVQSSDPSDPQNTLSLPQASLSALAAEDETRPSSRGLSLNLGTQSSIDRIGAIDVPSLEMPIDAVGSTLFKLDLSDVSCLTGETLCERRTEPLALGLSRSITARQNDDGLDLVLRPRASFKFDDDGGSSALVGAVVEIGEDLRTGSEFSANTWYLFAGADAEALTYSPDSLTRFNSGQFHLQDRIIVGDAQAGVGYRIGDADVSVSYLRREAQAEGLSFTEDAAALSFTWKR